MGSEKEELGDLFGLMNWAGENLKRNKKLRDEREMKGEIEGRERDGLSAYGAAFKLSIELRLFCCFCVQKCVDN